MGAMNSGNSYFGSIFGVSFDYLRSGGVSPREFSKYLLHISCRTPEHKPPKHFSLNNGYLEGSSILFLKYRQVRVLGPKVVAQDSVDPQSVDPQNPECILPVQ